MRDAELLYSARNERDLNPRYPYGYTTFPGWRTRPDYATVPWDGVSQVSLASDTVGKRNFNPRLRLSPGTDHKRSAFLSTKVLAEAVRFELTVAFTTTVFKTVPLGRSGTLPRKTSSSEMPSSSLDSELLSHRGLRLLVLLPEFQPSGAFSQTATRARTASSNTSRGSDGHRSRDLTIFSRALYQLSYRARIPSP